MYTPYGENGLEQIVDDHLSIITKEILTYWSGVSSIILVGSYAYGEGALYVTQSNAFPINDYDLYVVAETRHSSRQIYELQERCATSVKHYAEERGLSSIEREILANVKVDLRPLSMRDLHFKPPMQRYYDLKHGGLVLYGDDCLHEMPQYNASLMPKSDGLRLLFNEITHVLEILDLAALGRGQEAAAIKLNYFIAKACIAACSALLIIEGQYTVSIRDRLARLESLFGTSLSGLDHSAPRLLDRISRYNRLRLHPSSDDFVEHFAEMQEILDTVLRFCLGHFLPGQIHLPWPSLAGAISHHLWYRYYAPYMKRYAGRFLSRPWIIAPASRLLALYLSFGYFTNREVSPNALALIQNMFHWTDPGIALISCMPLLLFSIETNLSKPGLRYVPDQHSQRFLHFKLRRLLNCGQLKEWDDIQSAYVRAYRLYYWQKI